MPRLNRALHSLVHFAGELSFGFLYPTPSQTTAKANDHYRNPACYHGNSEGNSGQEPKPRGSLDVIGALEIIFASRTLPIICCSRLPGIRL